MYTVPKIKTLDQLKSYLHSGPGYDGYDVLLKSVQLNEEEYKGLCRWDAEHYVRIGLEKTDSYELILICWELGQSSAIHDHSGSEGWVMVLEGELTEKVYYQNNADGGALNLKEATLIVPGDIAYITDSYGYHSMIGSDKQRTVSLHLYAPAVDSFNLYNEQTGEIEKTVKPND